MKDDDKEGDKPIQLGLRLKLKDGKIIEAEHLIARNPREDCLQEFANSAPRDSWRPCPQPNDRCVEGC